MGQRANLVVIAGGRIELFYSHWRATTLPDEIFFGPAHAERMIRAQRSEADGAEWLDEVWAEGGVVLDHDRRLLLFWGGEDLEYDIAERRVFLALMRGPWRGWDVRWAYEGIADLADACGVPRARVLVDRADDAGPIDLAAPEDPSWVSGAVSARLDDGTIRIFPLDSHRPMIVRADAVRAAAAVGRDELHLPELPSAGTHVDLVRGTIELWYAHPAAEVGARLARHVPELRLIDHRDRFEAQLDACAGTLTFGQRGLEPILDGLRQRLLRRARDFSNVVAEATARDVAAGKDVEINPFALRDDPVDLPAADRVRVVDDAIAAWRASRG
ncbi:MAG: hypothetical protein H6708_31545 [Kofleriaceae bacterium]|nr:hypothetical protein [Myxococcales bacterium]MCB9564942.1 hypothetical protein [Kofleriaceae bacterium]